MVFDDPDESAQRWLYVIASVLVIKDLNEKSQRYAEIWHTLSRKIPEKVRQVAMYRDYLLTLQTEKLLKYGACRFNVSKKGSQLLRKSKIETATGGEDSRREA